MVMISSRPVCVSFCAASDGVRGVVGELNPSLTRRRVGEEDLSALCERFGGLYSPLRNFMVKRVYKEKGRKSVCGWINEMLRSVLWIDDLYG